MKLGDPAAARDPKRDISQAFDYKWPPSVFQDILAADYAQDNTVIKVQGDERDYLCSVELKDDGSLKYQAGAWDDIAPMMGLRHDYAQSRDAWDFFDEYEKIDTGPDFAAFLMRRDHIMDVPLFPPFEPEYVVETGQTRKVTSAMIREDYATIVNYLGAVVPSQQDAPADPVFYAWSKTATTADDHDKPVFVGRDLSAEYPRCLRLEFNPLTTAGASMVTDVVEKDGVYTGTYEWNNYKVEFVYSLHAQEGRYEICPDEWHARLNCKTLTHLAFSLVGNYDFWPHEVRERPMLISRANEALHRDMLLPLNYRFVDVQPGVRPYHVKSISSTTPVAPSDVKGLQAQLDYISTVRTAVFGQDLKENEALIMHPGSSLVHRVFVENAFRIEGRFCRIVPDLTNDTARQFTLFEMTDKGKAMGVFCSSPKAVTTFPYPYKTRVVAKFKVQSGESNAIRFEFRGHEFFIFRGMYIPGQLPQAYLRNMGKKDIQLPRHSFYINPETHTVLVSASHAPPDFLEQCEWFPGYHTVVPHSGAYMNRRAIIATRGIPVMDYIDACVASGMARALRSRLDLTPEQSLFADTQTTWHVPGVRIDLYAQLDEFSNV